MKPKIKKIGYVRRGVLYHWTFAYRGEPLSSWKLWQLRLLSFLRFGFSFNKPPAYSGGFTWNILNGL